MPRIPRSLPPFLVLLLMFVLSVATALPARAEEAPAPGHTAQDPTVSAEALGHLVKPLTQDDLTKELDHWQALLKQQQTAISDAHVAALALEGEARATALAAILPLVEERTRIYDRMRVVLNEYRAKGGDPAPYKAYADRVADVVGEIDVTDASGAWATVKAWASSDEGGKRWAKNIGLFLATLLVSWIVAQIVAAAFGRFMDSSFVRMNEMLERFFVNTVRNVVFAIGFVIGLSMLEVEIGPLLAAMGVVGFVLGFALQETLGNFAAGVMILVYQPYDLGDFVTAGGSTGSVVGMNLVSTVLKSPDNQRIVIPNGKIWGGTITNVTGNATRRVDLKFGIGYGDDVDRATAVLAEVVSGHEKILEDPEPVIRVHELADSSVNIIVRPWVKTSDYWEVYWDLTRTVKQRLEAEGLTIPFPQRDVHVHHVEAQSESASA